MQLAEAVRELAACDEKAEGLAHQLARAKEGERTLAPLLSPRRSTLQRNTTQRDAARNDATHCSMLLLSTTR